MIIDQEWGLSSNENPLQGSYIVDELTDLVEEAVLAEFDRITERGGVLGAMETGYQRGRIQDESMLYEHRKHDGSLPIIGVNTFLDPAGEAPPAGPGARPRHRGGEAVPAGPAARLPRQRTPTSATASARTAASMPPPTGGNVFEALMDAVRLCSLGQITDAFFEVGGQYRRNV